MKELYRVNPGRRPTTLLSNYYNGLTSISVADATIFDIERNNLTIFDADNNYVTLNYTTITGNVISGLTFVEGDMTAHFYSGAAYVVRTIDGYDFAAIHEHLNSKVDSQYSIEEAGKYLKIGEDGKIIPAEGGGQGTIDYSELINKPSINDVELLGNKSLEDLGIASGEVLSEHVDNSDIHVTTNDKANWDNKQNKVFYQEDTPTGAQVGDLWCYDGSDEPYVPGDLFEHHINIVLASHRALLTITTNNNVAFTTGSIGLYLYQKGFDGQTLDGRCLSATGCSTTSNDSIVYGLSSDGENFSVYVSSASGASVINDIPLVSVSDYIIQLR